MHSSLWGHDPFLRQANVLPGKDTGIFPERHEGDPLSKWDIFVYVYGILHHPEYRCRYKENLKRDLPHIPFCATDREFWVCVAIGEALMRMHCHYEEVAPYPLSFQWTPSIERSFHVQQMKLSHDKASIVVNGSLTLAGIPAEAHGYVLGNRTALEWIIDQYRITTDERSGNASDPNRKDDPKYIVRLLCQIVTVSVDTVCLVAELERRVNAGGWYGDAQVFAASSPMQ